MRKSLLLGILGFLLGSVIFYVIGAITLQNNINRANQILGLSQQLWNVEIKIGDKCDEKKNESLCKQKDDLSKRINQLIREFEGIKP